MTKERDDVLELIRKLNAKAVSAADIGNQAEAEAFAAKVQELLLRYKLSMTEVEVAEQDAVDPLGYQTYDPVSRGLDPKGRMDFKKRILWLEQLATAVARAHGCELVLSQHLDHQAYLFVGRRMDVELAGYVFTVLGRAGYDLSALEYRKAKREGRDTTDWYKTFQTAYAYAIVQRYRAERAKLEAQARVAGQGTALMRLDQDKVAVQAFMKQAFKLHSAGAIGGGSRDNDYARARGEHHGRQANLNQRGVGPAKEGTKALPPGPRSLPKGGGS